MFSDRVPCFCGPFLSITLRKIQGWNKMERESENIGYCGEQFSIMSVTSPCHGTPAAWLCSWAAIFPVTPAQFPGDTSIIPVTVRVCTWKMMTYVCSTWRETYHSFGPGRFWLERMKFIWNSACIWSFRRNGGRCSHFNSDGLEDASICLLQRARQGCLHDHIIKQTVAYDTLGLQFSQRFSFSAYLLTCVFTT